MTTGFYKERIKRIQPLDKQYPPTQVLCFCYYFPLFKGQAVSPQPSFCFLCLPPDTPVIDGRASGKPGIFYRRIKTKTLEVKSVSVFVCFY